MVLALPAETAYLCSSLLLLSSRALPLAALRGYTPGHSRILQRQHSAASCRRQGFKRDQTAACARISFRLLSPAAAEGGGAAPD